MVCIDGLEDSSNPPKEATPSASDDSDVKRDAEATAPVVPEQAAPEMFATGSEVMDDILEHSQQRMLEAFAHLSKRVDTLAVRKPAGPASGGGAGLSIDADMG